MSIAPGTQNGLGDDPPPGDPSDCWYIFHTHDDERVCPECAPLDGDAINGAWFHLHPPLHTNCRCRLSLDYCEEPLIPPEDPPGPGPF